MTERQLESLDLNLLLSLHWLLTERNVTEAATRLNLSQPATSRALGRLRRIFDDPLLVKSGRTMIPTVKAEALQPAVASAIEQMRHVLRVSTDFDPATASGRVRIASKDNIAIKLASTWEQSIAPLAPDLSLDLVDLTVAAARDLVSGKIDLVILPDTVLESPPPGVDLEQFVPKVIFGDKYVSALRRNHPLANTPLTLQSYTEFDHILINPGGSEYGLVDGILAQQNLSRHIKYRTSSFLTALSLVAQTDCIITAPAHFLDTGAEDLVLIEPPIEIPQFNVIGAWHPNWTHDTRHKWLRTQLFAELARAR